MLLSSGSVMLSSKLCVLDCIEFLSFSVHNRKSMVSSWVRFTFIDAFMTSFFSSGWSVRPVLIYLRNEILALWRVENVSKLIHMCTFGSVIMMLWSPYFSADRICFEIKSWWTKIGKFSLLICNNNEMFHIFCLYRDLFRMVGFGIIDGN